MPRVHGYADADRFAHTSADANSLAHGQSYANPLRNMHPDSDSDCDGDADSDAHARGADGFRHAHRDENRHRDRNAYAGAVSHLPALWHAQPDPYTHSLAYPISEPDAHRDGDGYVPVHTDAYRNPNCDANPNAHTTIGRA